MAIRIDEIVENAKEHEGSSIEVEINVGDGMKKKRNCYVDVGVSKYIKELNDWGYETCISCSGMEWDNHNHLKAHLLSKTNPNLKWGPFGWYEDK